MYITFKRKNIVNEMAQKVTTPGLSGVVTKFEPKTSLPNSRILIKIGINCAPLKIYLHA